MTRFIKHRLLESIQEGLQPPVNGQPLMDLQCLICQALSGATARGLSQGIVWLCLFSTTVFPLTGIVSKACLDFLSSTALASVHHTGGNPSLTCPYTFVQHWPTSLISSTSSSFRSHRITVTSTQLWEQRPGEIKLVLLGWPYQ